MAKYPAMDDLLRNQRRRRFRRRGGGGRTLLVVLVLAAAGVGAWLWWQDDAEPVGEVDHHAQALLAATRGVDDSVAAAMRPLEVEQAELSFDQAAQAQLTATWSEGEPATMRGELQKNQSVFLALQDRGLSPAAIHKAVQATGEKFNFRRSRPGDEWLAEVDAEGNITRFRYQTSPEDIWETRRTGDDGYTCEKVEVPVDVRREAVAGVVSGSLWQTLTDMGEDGVLIYKFADMFAYSIDFTTETQPGDAFAMVFEKVYLDGEFLRYGKVLAGRYSGGGKTFYGFWYEADDGEVGYYDEKGDNLQRQFLKSPLATIRVTSRFGKRFHPVLGRMKMHNGVDYGAPIGTPIQAVADGTVSYAGWKGANGKLIAIKHANGYSTYYAHLSKIEKGIRPGKRVTKKTVIGRVGNTGRSTGPHLHFGMKRHGKYVNPAKVDFARAEPLKGKEKQRYVDEIVDPLKRALDQAADAGAPAPRIGGQTQPSIGVQE